MDQISHSEIQYWKRTRKNFELIKTAEIIQKNQINWSFWSSREKRLHSLNRGRIAWVGWEICCRSGWIDTYPQSFTCKLPLRLIEEPFLVDSCCCSSFHLNETVPQKTLRLTRTIKWISSEWIGNTRWLSGWTLSFPECCGVTWPRRTVHTLTVVLFAAADAVRDAGDRLGRLAEEHHLQTLHQEQQADPLVLAGTDRFSEREAWRYKPQRL